MGPPGLMPVRAEVMTLNDELVSSKGQRVVDTAEVIVTTVVEEAGQLDTEAGQLTMVDSTVV
jgi:hypothetical protein